MPPKTKVKKTRMRVSRSDAYCTAARLAVEHAEEQGSLGFGMPDSFDLEGDSVLAWYRLLAIVAGLRLAQTHGVSPLKNALSDNEDAAQLVDYFESQGFSPAKIWDELEKKTEEIRIEYWPLIEKIVFEYRTTGRVETPAVYLAMEEEAKARKVLERTARREAKRVGLAAIKSRSKTSSANQGAFMLFDPINNVVIGGERFDWDALAVINYCLALK